MKAVREPHVSCYIAPAFGRGGESCTHRSQLMRLPSCSCSIPAIPPARVELATIRVKPDTSANCVTGASLVGAVGVEPTSVSLRGRCITVLPNAQFFIAQPKVEVRGSPRG